MHTKKNPLPQSNTQRPFTLSVWLPAGIVLLVLGLLTLLTPFFAKLGIRSFVLDMIAGGILLIAGIVGIMRGRKPETGNTGQ